MELSQLPPSFTEVPQTSPMCSFSDGHSGLSRGPHRPLLQVSDPDPYLPPHRKLWGPQGRGGRLWTQQGVQRKPFPTLSLIYCHLCHYINVIIVWITECQYWNKLCFMATFATLQLFDGVFPVVWVLQNPCRCSHRWWTVSESKPLECSQVSGPVAEGAWHPWATGWVLRTSAPFSFPLNIHLPENLWFF